MQCTNYILLVKGRLGLHRTKLKSRISGRGCIFPHSQVEKPWRKLMEMDLESLSNQFNVLVFVQSTYCGCLFLQSSTGFVVPAVPLFVEVNSRVGLPMISL